MQIHTSCESVLGGKERSDSDWPSSWWKNPQCVSLHASRPPTIALEQIHSVPPKRSMWRGTQWSLYIRRESVRLWCHSVRLLLSVPQAPPVSPSGSLGRGKEGWKEKRMSVHPVCQRRSVCLCLSPKALEWEKKRGGLVTVWKFKLANESRRGENTRIEGDRVGGGQSYEANETESLVHFGAAFNSKMFENWKGGVGDVWICLCVIRSSGMWIWRVKILTRLQGCTMSDVDWCCTENCKSWINKNKLELSVLPRWFNPCWGSSVGGL